MNWILEVTFFQLAMSFLTLFAIRESMIMFLPDEIAGPGGWLIDTGYEAWED